MLSRNRTGLIFAACGTLAGAGVYALYGQGTSPDHLKKMILIYVFSAGLFGWLLAHKLATPFRAFAILTGAVVMLGAQIPFAFITATYFALFEEPVPHITYWQIIHVLIMGGWAIAGIAQTIAGAIAGWLIHWLSSHDLYSNDHEIRNTDDPDG